MMKQFLAAAVTLALMHSAAARDGQHQRHGPAVGVPGTSADITRTVAVDMTDSMRFTPASITVRRGETVRFVVRNSGKLMHEMVLGSMSELQKHAVMMRDMPEMAHGEENMVLVAPGESGQLIWKFNAPGKVDLACLQPGHFEAGMKGQVAVK